MEKGSELVLEHFRYSGEEGFFLIAGPCVIESRGHTLKLARQLRDLASGLGIPLIFKASFDKANRTSSRSYRGPGLETGLSILREVKSELGIPVLSDIHEPSQAASAADILDVIQIPAFLCRQTDLVEAAAVTGRPLNIKKGQFMAPWDMVNVVRKAEEAGCKQLLLTERGVSFGYNNLVVDFKSIPIMKKLGYPVVFDATHSVQLPGGRGSSSGGAPEYIPVLARAAAAAGIDGFFFEVHDNPEEALSDGANSLKIGSLGNLLPQLLRISKAVDLDYDFGNGQKSTRN
jgi:2-dehydro-3-deoxyphosphooctonate aldolase (KDO 8-P synthase)